MATTITNTLAPLTYTQQVAPNKDTNLTYTQLFASWFPISHEQAKLCNKLFNEFYFAVRLIDDVQDETKTRNGKPTANIVFGVPLTINAGMLATTQLIERLFEFNNEKAMRVFLEEFKLMWEGQGEQLLWTENKTCPSLDEVIKMSEKKGIMVTLFGRFLCALAGKDDTPFRELFKKFNLILQVENDISGTADLRDVTEGQYNSVIAYAVTQEKKLNGTSRLEQILLSKTSDLNELNEARNILISTRAFEFANDFKASIMTDIIACTKAIGGNKFCEDIITIYGIKKLNAWHVSWENEK